MPFRILIIQLADIGDLVLSTPALAALREAHPTVHLALLTTAHSAPIIHGTGLVDQVITFDKHTFDSPKALLRPRNMRKALSLAAQLRRGQYDTILFFHHFTTRFGALKFAALGLAAGSPRRIGLQNGNGFFLTESLEDEGFGARHQAEYWLALAAVLGASAQPRPAHVAMEPSSTPEKRRIAIHAGSGGYSMARRWEPAHFAQVADVLHAEIGAEIVLVGGKGDDTALVREAMQAPVTDLSGQTTLPQLAGILSGCELFIGADSGVMHIAAASGVPVVAIFGPSNPAAWSPWTPNGQSVLVRSAPECSPCSYVGHGLGLRHGCAARTCMRMVTPQQVIDSARAVLSQMPTSSTAEPQSSSPPTTHRQYILGIPVDGITYNDLLSLIEQWVRSGNQAQHVCTVNPEFVMMAQKDANFRHILQRARLCVPDGVGLLWAAKRRGRPLPQRVTGSDGVPIIAERAAQQGWRLFLLGAAPGIAEKAASILCERYRGLHIAGTYSGSPDAGEEDAIVAQVNASGADILFVAYGAPAQDAWIARNLPRLNVAMAMGVGGAFDFIAGIVPRAPESMRRLGLEWLYRLYLQPWRIRRMIRLPRFVLAVLRERTS